MRKVRCSLTLTKNLGNYESVKFDCGFEVEQYEGSSWEETYNNLAVDCMRAVNTQIQLFAQANDEKLFEV